MVSTNILLVIHLSRSFDVFSILRETSKGASLMIMSEVDTLSIIAFKTAPVQAALFIGIFEVKSD